jgi:hypothetical protein
MSNNFFLYIVEKYFDCSNNAFIIYSNNNTTNNSAQRYIFKCFSNIKNYNYNKFKFYTEILKNTFMPDFMKHEFINNFIKIQRVYHILNKLKFSYKYKKSKIIVDCDLCLNKLDINHNLTFCLYQGNNRYLFNINEIVKTIVTSLINSPLFFSEPLVSKNPYNNIPLSKSTLYNIYFTLQRKNIKIHELFYKFFLHNFDLTEFKKYNEHLIREYAIDNYIKNSTDDLTYNVILSMLVEYNKLVNKKDRFKFCFNFPRDKILLAFKPFLSLYYKSKYSLIKTVKINSSKYLFANLLKFKKINICFGRKMYKMETRYVNFIKKTKMLMYYFDTINKLKLSEHNFLESHLSCDEENIDVELNSLYYNGNIDYSETSYNNNLYYPIYESETETHIDLTEDEEDIDEEADIDEEDEEDEDQEDEDEDQEDEEDIYEVIDEEEDIDEEDSIS